MTRSQRPAMIPAGCVQDAYLDGSSPCGSSEMTQQTYRGSTIRQLVLMRYSGFDWSNNTWDDN